jgi:hypothetical protein
LASVSPDDLAEARDLRRTFGLRADEDWIRLVGADPAAKANMVLLGIPLTDEEREELEARATNSDRIADMAERYGEAQPDWAGLFIDQQARGAVVALFTDRLEEHRAAIARQMNPLARWDVRLARWTLKELEASRARVDREREWLRTIGAWWAGSGISRRDNAVLLDISSANPLASTVVLEHLGDPPWLRVRSDAIGRWEGPRGTLVAIAVRPNGEPAAHLDCMAIPDVPSALQSGDVAFGTNDQGVCRIEGVGATGYLVELGHRENDRWQVLGRGRVVVPPDGEGVVRIVIHDNGI